MARIYLTGSGQTKGHATGSGVISNPARILLQERDNHTGSYPTIARTGDPDFTGRYQSFYDDTNTVNFVGNSQTLFPMNLPANSKWVSGNVATPNILQGLTTFGTASKGVSDVHVSFTPGQNISPFNESRIYIDNDSSFYRTGTSTSILENFDQRLSSKAIITIDVNPTSRTNFFFSTGSTVSGRSVNSGIGYYSWTEKKWHLIRSSGTGSNVDYVNPSAAIRSATPHAFTSRAEFYPNASPSLVSDTAPHIGVPHSTCGFPFATQFDATGSQILHMTSSLTSPFLIEKISMEFSASFPAFIDEGQPGLTSFGEGPNVYQFFLMRIGRQPVNLTVSIEQDLTGSSTGIVANSITNQFTINQYKDLIWTGEIARYDSNESGAEPIPVGKPQWKRDLNLTGSSSPGILAITGTYRVEAPCRIFGNSQGLLTTPLRAEPAFVGGPTQQVPLLANKLGGRNFAGISEGRSFVRSVVGTVSSGTLYVDDSSTAYKYAVPKIATVRFDSPYILMPEDDLVLGFANQSIISGGPTGSTYVSYTEDKIAQQVVTLAPGAGKLTLFGSLLRNNLPVSSEINQPLTSDAIHEDLHYDNPVFDQFDVEPIAALTGSYVDLIITGSMLVTPFGNTAAENVRKVQASAAAGQAGSTGSLQRFVNLSSNSDVLYDSYPPNVGTILSNLGKGLIDSSGDAYLVLTTGTSYPDFDNGWYFRSAYEISSNRFTQFKISNIVANSYDGSGNLVNSNVSPAISQAFITDESTGVLRFAKLSAKGNSYSESQNNWNKLNEAEKINLMYKYIFCFGDDGKFPNATRFQTGPGVQLLYAFNSIRGYKYGLAGLFGTYTSTRFRRDRYGQFRDMLEQSPNAAYFVANSVEYPLEVKFFSRPGKDAKGNQTTDPQQTHSQNLSNFATSSLPYFDGVARERPDNPDVTLKSLNLT